MSGSVRRHHLGARGVGERRDDAVGEHRRVLGVQGIDQALLFRTEIAHARTTRAETVHEALIEPRRPAR
ncbi:hypothetical protein [Rhodococcus sp. BS-15]|uniref:hypothetical protein n=1 Tax=Rhodococcus sp. BS-15 TaxID=1304954 RepID=UPI000A7A8371|nr:hypothetical protein [Rhodococcus sp. BS-15]